MQQEAVSYDSCAESTVQSDAFVFRVEYTCGKLSYIPRLFLCIYLRKIKC